VADGSAIPPNTQYLRNWSIQVYNVLTQTTKTPTQSATLSEQPGGLPEVTVTGSEKSTTESLTEGLDLSQFRTTFDINAAETETPNTAIIKVYNVSPDTARALTGGSWQNSEFSRVVLQAGYGDKLGTIFDGQIKQCFIGRESPVDTFALIHAADGDDFYNFSVIAQTLKAGATNQDLYNALQRSATQQGLITWQPLPASGQLLPNTGGVLPRGKVLWGMSRVALRMAADRAGMTWSIKNGKVVFAPFNSPGDGAIIDINSQTGMVNIPIQTNLGIIIKTLINPDIQVGSRVRLNNRDVLQSLLTINRANFTSPMYDQANLRAHLRSDATCGCCRCRYRGGRGERCRPCAQQASGRHQG
jgi:hypothetical protein